MADAFKRWWLLLALLTPALIMGTCKLWTGGTKRVPIAGGGAIAELSKEDAPEGFRYDLAIASDLGTSVANVRAAITTWPDIVVFGLPAGSPDELRTAYAQLTLAVENATAVPIVIGPAGDSGMYRWWRETSCTAEGLRICVDPAEGQLNEAVRRAIVLAKSRHDSLRASTQVSR